MKNYGLHGLNGYSFYDLAVKAADLTSLNPSGFTDIREIRNEVAKSFGKKGIR